MSGYITLSHEGEKHSDLKIQNERNKDSGFVTVTALEMIGD